ncbi:MAG: hypothetical protein ACLUN6_03770 [Holdemanella sp.]|uniref:hypothetical protein n=1 Tax=Holdemanella sp. TaxID=1971762 RepID=UPI003993F45D
MWAGKWALALWYGSEGFWSTLVGSLEVRTSHEVRGVGEISRLDALWKAASVFFKKPYFMAGAAALLGYGAVFVRRRVKGFPSEKNSRGLAAALVCVALAAAGVVSFHRQSYLQSCLLHVPHPVRDGFRPDGGTDMLASRQGKRNKIELRSNFIWKIEFSYC